MRLADKSLDELHEVLNGFFCIFLVKAPGQRDRAVLVDLFALSFITFRPITLIELGTFPWCYTIFFLQLNRLLVSAERTRTEIYFFGSFHHVFEKLHPKTSHAIPFHFLVPNAKNLLRGFPPIKNIFERD